MRILVIDQCSGSKRIPAGFDPYDSEAIESHGREELLTEVRDQVPALRAEQLYQGRQQQFITEACNKLETAGDTVDRVFISAGFGVVDATTELPPYDVTFANATTTEIQTRGEALGIHADLEARLTTGEPYDLVFFALGTDYLASFDAEALLSELPQATMAIVFNHPDLAANVSRIRSIPARTEEAEELGTIVIALKGKYLQHFAEHRAQGSVPTDLDDVERYCTAPPTSQSTLG